MDFVKILDEFDTTKISLDDKALEILRVFPGPVIVSSTGLSRSVVYRLKEDHSQEAMDKTSLQTIRKIVDFYDAINAVAHQKWS